MIMANHGCWTAEYDWVVSLDSKPRSRETILCVLFDDGAQRQFSGIRITLLRSKDATRYHAWQIQSRSPALSVVNHAPPLSQDGISTQNDPSLPICNIVFTAGRHSARLQTTSGAAEDRGELVLTDTVPPEDSPNIVFEYDQPLAKNTESVSVSFTSSHLLCTMISHGVFSDSSSDYSRTVGRVVRVFPADPTNRRKHISIPRDVLLLIFEALRFPSTYRDWRKDVLSSALVCREWTCALNALLVDFRSKETQQGYPPEISRFASGLAAHPSLGLGIKYLSVEYLEKHFSWDPYPEIPPGRLSAMFLAKLELQQANPRRSRFCKAFLSILSVAKNLQTLRLNPAKGLVVASDDLLDVLCGLDKLEILEGRCPLTMAQLISCIATWPSLKHLSVLDTLPPVDNTFPLASPSCCLTVLELFDTPVKDDELTCLVNASGTTLERLTLSRISHLTNAGLSAALNIVCTSLTYLYIMGNALVRGPGEEHALDTTITRMERLVTLKIAPDVASERMVERRAEAFKQRSTPTLPEVYLQLLVGGEPEHCGLIAAACHVWPGWKIAQLGWASALGIPSLYL